MTHPEPSVWTAEHKWMEELNSYALMHTRLVAAGCDKDKVLRQAKSKIVKNIASNVVRSSIVLRGWSHDGKQIVEKVME